ncbi:restriction endonuclease [Helicobacter sp. MIT 05-5293]|uniref:restriction endonuclease n=1 Tax=Helicobacter sp. MIT 05-5293 TaxID=1548149 RepID=UPI00051E06D5|nr:restriction endonuclease [Helicobacter sp. MIT 05-5293]TLD82054.1 restriction endonuclease [Helicobacter sp. MIT 05-5293]
MNYFLNQSIELANQRDYLDQLFRVYPMCPDNIREIDSIKWNIFEQAFSANQQEQIIESLLNFDLFPIKDSYIAYLRRDRSAIKRNPATIARICGRLQEMGLDEIYKSLSQPKETNRQIGPLFKRWVNSGILGIQPVSLEIFKNTNDNAILNASDLAMQEFAREYLGYTRLKGLDFIAKFNGKIIIGEAKFLSDFGGHQNAQLEDAISLLNSPLDSNIIKIAILDGVCYIQGKHKMFETLTNSYQDDNILSALLLRDFLYQV